MMNENEEENKMMVIKENKKVNYITLLSVISAIAVIIEHVKGGNIEDFSATTLWRNINIIEGIVHFAVPIFFMISGATLIDYRDRYSTKEFLKRRFKKTVIPFLFWSVISILYAAFIRKKLVISNLNAIQFFNAIMKSVYMFPYWFFPALFSTYLSIPLLSAVEKKIRKEVYGYLLITISFFNYILPFINNVFELNLVLPVVVYVGTGYILHIIIGYLLHTSEIDKKTEIMIYIMGAIGLFLQIFGTYTLSMREGRFIATYKGYENVSCILYSAAIFLLVKNLCSKIKNKTFYSIINRMKKYTFSIYLLHWFCIDFILLIFKPNVQSLLYTFIMPVIVVPVCILITYILRKIPVVRHIVPE